MMYDEKCKDMHLKKNLNAQKRFVEQFMGSIQSKSLKLNGLGLGPGCAMLLKDILSMNRKFVFSRRILLVKFLD